MAVDRMGGIVFPTQTSSSPTTRERQLPSGPGHHPYPAEPDLPAVVS